MIAVVLLVSGCRKDFYDRKPIDELSQIVKESVGDSYVFLDREIKDDTNIWYSFEIREISPMTIERIVDTFNENLSPEKTQTSLTVCIPISGGSGGSVSMFAIRNYTLSENGVYIYDNMCCLSIYYVDQDWYDDTVCYPELYSQIEGIRELHVAKEIQDKADDIGIDWHDYWPDLETIVIER